MARRAIGISGSYGGMNHGDEAILRSMVASLRERLPDSDLTVFSRDAADTRTRHDGVDRVIDIRRMTGEEAAPEVQRLDLLLLGGGGLLFDGEARQFLREVGLARRHGVPSMTYAIGAGPLDDPAETEAVAGGLNDIAAVTVRDSGAQRILEQAGVERPIEVTADPTLLLLTEPFGEEQLAAEGVRPGRPVVGMSIREPGAAAPDLDVGAYASLLAHTADFVVRRFAADVLFIPMERADFRLSHMVMSRMVRADHAHVLKGDYPAGMLLGVMEHLDFVIGARLHVLIFAALSGTPFLALPYAAKVSDFIASVGVAEPPPISRDSAGALIATVDEAWDRREAEAARLRRAVRPLQELAERTLEIAAGLVERRAGEPEEPDDATGRGHRFNVARDRRGRRS
jgi:polysaccharide pyruvyl transferase CsaB